MRLLALALIIVVVVVPVVHHEFREWQIARQLTQIKEHGALGQRSIPPTADTIETMEAGQWNGRRIRTLEWRTYFGSTVYFAYLDAANGEVLETTRVETHSGRQTAYAVLCLLALIATIALAVELWNRVRL